MITLKKKESSIKLRVGAKTLIRGDLRENRRKLYEDTKFRNLIQGVYSEENSCRRRTKVLFLSGRNICEC